MEKIKAFWLDFFRQEQNEDSWWNRKKALWEERGGEIVRIEGNGRVFEKIRFDHEQHDRYLIHLTYLIKQDKHFHIEEQVIPYQFSINSRNEIMNHDKIKEREVEEGEITFPEREAEAIVARFSYDRLAAVQYAERWWNGYNPEYHKFTVDCTNFISQCLRAGGAPMHGASVRERGWWYVGNNWSFSWAVAHSLRWYLSGSRQGLQAKEMMDAAKLIPGDVICYDFQGNGKWDHNTIVVAKDAYGMPLVNAHTDNSRHRYWSYEDSTAWTPNIQYKFFRISGE
ncbi:hypothetical protein CWR48_11160 [Oceanobacillus arenosus]|uniref:Putative amidase domain-containing protein n=1 Tax=Oceanobacillus arenosus TaxID=1229153 RepID=A0A3D8PPT3_9BACI|nr:amidase domain-containing protein [Oceanobacillus arenosus]RDW18140.1 hypothetical protein CWR48_11160 [Oceanobacillus arenosus]